MKKIIILIVFISISSIFSAKIILKDYNQELQLPPSLSQTVDATKDIPISFSFKIGKIDGDISIFGNWDLKIGYGAGFTIYPELEWILTKSNMNEGIIFDQKRIFSLDWTSDRGLYFHLFFNDDANDTEFTFKYEVGKLFNSLYITNKFPKLEVNPYRSLKGGRAQDINFGFDWGNNIYKGRFDIQFDSVKKIVDRFKGGKKEINKKLISSQFERGIYYYLPDKNITGNFEVYLSDINGSIYSEDETDDRRYKTLYENVDYILDERNGYIKFKESIYGRNLLIFYQVDIDGNIYNVGDQNAGRNGVYGRTDFDKNTFPEYFTKLNNRDFLILNFSDKYTFFEEKNSYRIATNGAKVTNLNTDILDINNERLSGYKIIYDEYSGCMRIKKNEEKGNEYNIYPFYDLVDENNFYLLFYTPTQRDSTVFIDYSCFIYGEGLKLSSKPVEESIIVYFNSVILEPSKYAYDFVSQSISTNFEVSNTDIIEVHYVTEEEDAYNITAVLKNDFRLNKYILIGDSYWYKMPIKLWEESYYFRSHSIEFLYNVHLNGDFHSFLNDKNGTLKFDLNAGLSLFYPELKGLTLVDDFEYELQGYKLDLHYNNWYPVSIPSTVFGALSSAGYGRIFFRNMHRLGIVEGSDFISIYDANAPGKDSYIEGSRIGPYSSADGFTYDLNDDQFEDRSNTLSLVTEFELDAKEAVSIVLPVSAIDEFLDFSSYSGLNVAVKSYKLQGDLRMYIDAGQVSERFKNDDPVVQKELLDEGIRYLIDDSGSFYLYKGKNDGIISTNDLDGNGYLDKDSTTDISRFIYSDTSSDFAQITQKYNNMNFTIEHPDRLRSMRGIRITLYSATGASGRLLFNQIRFIQSGWEYDMNGRSTASEISPIEDSYLLDHIFSENNLDIDKKLHFQRFKERTMKLDIKQNEEFYIYKRFINPIDLNHYLKFSFFLLLQKQMTRKLKITLTDIYGNKMTKIKSLKDLKKGKWHEFSLPVNTFDGYNINSKLITEVRMDFIDEASDTDDNVVYLDEIYLDNAVPLVGFGTKNKFEYSEPSLEFKYKDFSIFRSPFVLWETSFNTINFLVEEMSPKKDYIYNNKLTVKFRFIGIDHHINTNFDLVFRNNAIYNPFEELQLKLNKNATNKSPVMFAIVYDYNKFGLPVGNEISVSNLVEDRNLILELGGKARELLTFKFGYDISTNKRMISSRSTKLYTDYTLNAEGIYNKFYYSIENLSYSKNLDGIFSLDNIGYLLRDDFVSFVESGSQKGQNFLFRFGAYILPLLYFSNDIKTEHKGIDFEEESLYEIKTKFSNKYQFTLKVEHLGIKNDLFITQYTRKIENYYSNRYNTISWYDYFNEFGYSIGYITPIIFYPPFSSIYKVDNKHVIDRSIKYNNLTDIIRLIWDWGFLIRKDLFLPYSFEVGISESIVNKVIYTPSYIVDLVLYGMGELATNIFRNLEFKYSVAERLDLKKDNNSYKTTFDLNLNLYTYRNLDIESSLSYELTYTDGLNNELLDHRIKFSTMQYKNFFKKNYITNDKYGIEISFLTELSSAFHNRLDNRDIDKVDNPIDLEFTPKIGYRFNRNFTLSGVTKYGYSLDYSRTTDKVVHRFGAEFYLEGKLSF